MSRLTTAIAFMFLSSAAHAESVVQFSGDTACKGRNAKDTLSAADLKAGSAWAPFVKYKDDDDISHYDIRSGVLYYTPANLAAPYDAVVTSAKDDKLTDLEWLAQLRAQYKAKAQSP